MSEQQQPGLFSIEDIATYPSPGMVIPNSFAFNQDDTQLTYLLAADEKRIQQLYALDVATGASALLIAPPQGGVQEEKLSPEEELRRQRQRSLAVGLTQYGRAEHADRILIPLTGDIYVWDGTGEPLRHIVASDSDAPAITPALSPDGEQIAFVRDAELYVVPAAGGTPKQITAGARGSGKTNGLAEYIAQEEFHRSEGFWWSPDSRLLAYTEVDETHIPLYRIEHQGSDTPGEEEAHHYPFAGAANAHVRLAVVATEDGEPIWMDLTYDEEIYLVNVFWWHDGSLGAVVVNREQTWLNLVRFDIHTGQRTSVLRETSDYWINDLRQPLIELKSGGFVWASERSGFCHLYLYDGDGVLLRQLTDGAWVVDAIQGIDERNRLVYFTGNREQPTETHLYAVSLDGGEPRRITTEPGTHNVTLDHACQRFVDIYSALDTPPRVALRALADGAPLHAIATPPDPRIAAFALQPPEIVTLRNREGTLLYGAIYRPLSHFGPGPYPTIVDVYGGPGPQAVANHWGKTAAMRIQYLRAQGYLVFQLDNRGSARRGLEFEGAIKHRMGTIEVEDQVDGVHWLVEQGLTDPARVGVVGWSYGGYMALLCLAKAADTFKVAVSGAPVASQDGYDTAYTERYMGTPQSNPTGYAEGSVMNHVDKITGKLLIVHGMLDENVHFRHTARLINALIRARKPFDLLPFPGERHMARHRPDRIYLEERIVDYFQQHL